MATSLVTKQALRNSLPLESLLNSLPSDTSKLDVRRLRLQTTSLYGTLQSGSQGIFLLMRAGGRVGIPCSCPFCDEKPPKGMSKTYERRRWQVSHMAVRHVKGETPVFIMKTLEGVGTSKPLNGNGNGHRKAKRR